VASLTIFLAQCALGQSNHQQANLVKPENTSNIIFNAEWLEPLSFALADLKSNDGFDQIIEKCYWIDLEKDDKMYVSFYSNKGFKIVHVNDDEIMEEITLPNECGVGVTYEFSLSGEFLKKYYIR